MAASGAALKDAMDTVLTQPGWSVSRLARETGIGRGRFYIWWQGLQRPRVSTLQRVARVMGLDPNSLVSAYGDPQEVVAVAPDPVAAAIDRQTEVLRDLRDVVVLYSGIDMEEVRRRAGEAERALRERGGGGSLPKRVARRE